MAMIVAARSEMRLSSRSTVSPGEREPQAAASGEIEVIDEGHAHERAARRSKEARSHGLLRTQRAGDVLPASREGELLRDDADGNLALRVQVAELPVTQAARASVESEAAWREFHARLRAFVARRV